MYLSAMRILGDIDAPDGETRPSENFNTTKASRGAPTPYTDSTAISVPYTTEIEGDVPIIGHGESREVPFDNDK